MEAVGIVRLRSQDGWISSEERMSPPPHRYPHHRVTIRVLTATFVENFKEKELLKVVQTFSYQEQSTHYFWHRQGTAGQERQ